MIFILKTACCDLLVVFEQKSSRLRRDYVEITSRHKAGDRDYVEITSRSRRDHIGRTFKIKNQCFFIIDTKTNKNQKQINKKQKKQQKY